MKKLFIIFFVMSALVITGLAISTRNVECNNCNSGNPCNDTFDCGELGVCICWYSGEQESLTGSPGKNGICQMQSQ